MLTTCKECQGVVSDQASVCPHCGFPVKKVKPTNVPKASKYRRLPNGFGTIRKLGGKRRKPFACYPPTVDYYENGTPKPRKALGYYETWNDAYMVLCKYNNDKNGASINSTITLKKCFEEFYQDRFVDTKKRVAKGTEGAFRTAINKHCASILNEPIAELKFKDLQNIVNNVKSHHIADDVINALRAVTNFAIKCDYIEKDYAQYLENKFDLESESGVPFFEEELQKIWERRGDVRIQYILIMIFTGMRISEYEDIEINMDEWYFRGGLKTQAGRDRIIPIHEKIRPFIKEGMYDNYKATKFRKSFNKAMKDYGLEMSIDDTKHTPHDCRHTFNWLCDKYGLSKTARYKIMGHKSKDIEVDVYGHKTIEELHDEISKITVDFLVD